VHSLSSQDNDITYVSRTLSSSMAF
jgi:hypothetical protein